LQTEQGKVLVQLAADTSSAARSISLRGLIVSCGVSRLVRAAALLDQPERVHNR